MACLISFVFIALNCLSLLSGFIAISCAAYVQFNGSTICQKALEAPLLVTGLILLLVSLLGLIGSCCRANGVLFLYLFFMFFLIIGLLVFTIFILAVTNKAVGKRISANPLQDYSQWLQKHARGRKWQQIKGCLIDAKVCNDLNDVNIKDWSLIQVLFFLIVGTLFKQFKPETQWLNSRSIYTIIQSFTHLYPYGGSNLNHHLGVLILHHSRYFFFLSSSLFIGSFDK